MQVINRSSIVFLLLLTLTAVPHIAAGAWTGRFLYEENLDWRSNRDLTSSQFGDLFTSYSNQGYIIVDVDVRTEGTSASYSMVWQKNIDGRGWREHRNLTSEQYHDLWVQYRDSGYRPLDVEAYMLNGNLRFAGIWIENVEGLAWASTRNMTSSEYADYFSQKSSEGYRPIDIEIYQTDNGMRVAAIWYDNVDNLAWSQLRNIDRTRYQQEVDDHSAGGFMMIDFESYDTGSEQLYAAIWEESANRPSFAIRTDRSELDFANLWRTTRDLGLRLTDFESYNINGQVEPGYGGIWVGNEDRIRFDLMFDIDKAISDYWSFNALPGISVAVVRNGKMIYRRGYGLADVDGGKLAHGETVYSAASVSKVFGGTLAARLEDKERLLDGTTFELDLTRLTDDYLGAMPLGGDLYAAMPSQHTHTIEQLLSHLGCVAHYNTTPNIPDQSIHYPNAKAAVQSIWDTGLVTATTSNPSTSCTVGSTWSYSTHAFTFAGAVLETATGKGINTLLEDEIFNPKGLSKTRVMFETASLPANYDRAKPYKSRDTIHSSGTNPPGDWNDPPDFVTNPNVDSGDYPDTSWKVLGGGIETTAVDLARFGWYTLNGDIVDAAARDSRMWTRVGGIFNGLAWNIFNVDGYRVADHGGTQTGARTFLRVYRDEGLVIAIMSNRRDHRRDMDQDVDDLAREIGNIIIDNLNHNGDIDGDGDRDLTDLIITLQLLTGKQPTSPIYLSADVDGNRKIDNAEAISIIQQIGR